MTGDPAAQHKTIMAVDIAGYNDPKRTTTHQLVVHEGFWKLLQASFDEVGIPWDDCFKENTGDGAMIQLPAEIAKAGLVARLPDCLLAELRRYNTVHADEANVQLRVALHSGEVFRASHGTVSQATSFTFRILDAPEAKSALKESGAMLALIVSDEFYHHVVAHDPAADPGSYQRIRVRVKETATEAWLRLIGAAANGVAPFPRAAMSTASVGGERREALGTDLSLDQIWELTELLLTIPSVAEESGRRVLLSWLRPEIRAMVPHHSQTRLHVLELVRTCARYQGGLAELVMTIQMLEPGSEPVRRLSDQVARWRTIDRR
ncbi:hypothetical protein AB0L41_38240 [Amycolatopsis mediterranei]|uniref:effector-associated domain 2-containing protein n=1 Tax=Amycolatopsis mediterranei TaxID=33910 RepID=UPI003440955B